MNALKSTKAPTKVLGTLYIFRRDLKGLKWHELNSCARNQTERQVFHWPLYQHHHLWWYLVRENHCFTPQLFCSHPQPLLQVWLNIRWKVERPQRNRWPQNPYKNNYTQLHQQYQIHYHQHQWEHQEEQEVNRLDTRPRFKEWQGKIENVFHQ